MFLPTQEAKDLFVRVNDRWNALAKWGVVEKIPNQHAAIEDWKAYRDAWIAERWYYIQPGTTELIDVVPALSAQVNALNSVEADAKSLGYAAPQPLQGIDATAAVTGGETAADIDQAARAAAAAAAGAPGSLWASIPWYVKLGGAVFGVALVVDAVRR